jgi:hypothetical protein
MSISESKTGKRYSFLAIVKCPITAPRERIADTKIK